MRSSISCRILARTDMSSIEIGSSATSTLGSMMIARAITTRCFCPPDRSRGYLVRNSSTGESPTRSSASTTLARRSSADFMPCTRSASPTPSSTVIVGFSAALGSWNTIWTSRRISRSRRAAQRGDVLTLEEDGAVGRGSQTRAARGPAWTCRCRSRRPGRRPRPGAAGRLTPSTALTVPVSCPNSRARLPPRRPKCTERSRMSMHGGLAAPASQASSATVSSSCFSGCVPPSGIWSFGPASQHSTRPPPVAVDVDRVL